VPDLSALLEYASGARGSIAIAAAISIASIVISLIAAAWVAVRIPVDYFVVRDRPLPFAGHSWPLRVGARVVQNVLGLFLIALGIVLSLPGVPGQGLLTILLGVMLADLPGKRRLERRIVKRPVVHRAINRVRARWNKPPIDVPHAEDAFSRVD
jgi:hypothetical protein